MERKYDTYIFAAPVEIKTCTGETEINYVAAVVKKSGTSNRYYLHEVVDRYGDVIYTKRKSNRSLIDNSATGFKTASLRDNNIPLLNNSISDTNQNYNADLEKNIDTLPDRLAQNKPVTEHTADESRQIVAQAMLID